MLSIVQSYDKLFAGPKKDSEGNEQKNVHQNMKGKIKHNTTNKISARLLSVTKANDTTSTTTLNPKVKEDDEILCCGGCGCYGMSGEFLNSEACSSSCQVCFLARLPVSVLYPLQMFKMDVLDI
jgi:hypothetical protein